MIRRSRRSIGTGVSVGCGSMVTMSTRTPAPAPVRHVDDRERRARLARRHALGGAHRVPTIADAVAATVCLHATEPATPYLSLFARLDDVDRPTVARALYEERSIVKHLAMRRTLFGFPPDLLPAALGSASARVAAQQRRQLPRDLARTGGFSDPEATVAEIESELLRVLAANGPATTGELAEAAPATLAQRLDGIALTPRVLTILSAEGRVYRGAQSTGWRSSRPRWTLAEQWVPDLPAPLTPAQGYAVLVAAWLRAFGPGTESDLVWWLGATKAAVRAALQDVGAVPVSLDGTDDLGWLLPDDLEPEPPVDPWVALLPVLDATTMGWKQRDFYLGPHAPLLFDSAGNAGTTAWVDGRVVGGWHQDADGVVVVSLLEDVPAPARRALDAEADRLTSWLAGERVGTVYPSPLMRERTGLSATTRGGPARPA